MWLEKTRGEELIGATAATMARWERWTGHEPDAQSARHLQASAERSLAISGELGENLANVVSMELGTGVGTEHANRVWITGRIVEHSIEAWGRSQEEVAMTVQVQREGVSEEFVVCAKREQIGGREHGEGVTLVGTIEGEGPHYIAAKEARRKPDQGDHQAIIDAGGYVEERPEVKSLPGERTSAASAMRLGNGATLAIEATGQRGGTSRESWRWQKPYWCRGSCTLEGERA